MTPDLLQAVRFLARHKGYALVGILTVAVGVGVNAAMFSVSDFVLFRPLPYCNADRLLDREIEPYRFNMRLVSVFGALALGLAALGIYGVLSFLTAERRREYGIRAALGATRHQLHRLVLEQAALPILVGLAAGLAAASALSRLVASFLYHVAPLDSVSYIGAAAVILVAGLLAALDPALRAGRIDPIAVLKTE